MHWVIEGWEGKTGIVSYIAITLDRSERRELTSNYLLGFDFYNLPTMHFILYFTKILLLQSFT